MRDLKGKTIAILATDGYEQSELEVPLARFGEAGAKGDLNIKLRPKILDMKPGTRVVSNSFTMGEWKSDQTVTATDGCTSYCTAYLWIVPAKVAGTWKLADGELTLRQDFQMLGGTLKSSGNSASISNARMNGDQISFSAGGVQYTGRINGNTMEGTTKGGTKWSATRAGK